MSIPLTDPSADGGLGDLIYGPEAAEAFVAAGEKAFVGTNELRTAGFQSRHVLLRSRVQPHFAVHGGGDQQFCLRVEGQSDASEGVVGNAVREFGNDVCGG